MEVEVCFETTELVAGQPLFLMLKAAIFGKHMAGRMLRLIWL